MQANAHTRGQQSQGICCQIGNYYQTAPRQGIGTTSILKMPAAFDNKRLPSGSICQDRFEVQELPSWQASLVFKCAYVQFLF